MDSTFDAFLRSWPSDPWLLAGLLLVAAIYTRGWFNLRRRDPGRWRRTKLVAFLSGLTAIFLALASPIEPFASLLLQVHMAQHLLLTMVAPPLLWLGSPLVPILRGLAEPIRTYWIAPLIGSRQMRRFFQALTHPFLALPLFVAATWLWHVPAFYELALRSTAWHYVQHSCFLGSALLFWYPVVRPYPSRPRWSLWLLFPYLIIADIQNTVLSALLTFSERVLYPSYSEVPRIAGLSALDDQSAAGVLMWVPGSLVYLLPLFAIGVRLLSHRAEKPSTVVGTKGTVYHLPILATQSSACSRPAHRPRSMVLDLARMPVLGRFLRWKYARSALQLFTGVLAVILIYDGLYGPQVASMNLAGIVPWIHWRGLVIMSLLLAGNVSCMVCPFTLPRTLTRAWFGGGFPWPDRLKNKWLALCLLALFLWAYEAYSLWDSPAATAWIIVAYFIAAFVVDVLFRGGTFCKYVCPIGQFNFVQSLLSPFQVSVRARGVCATCQTHDCIRGRDHIAGCEMNLFQPRKSSNMDCTFCLDCVHACPHENVGILAGWPGKDLWDDPFRSGIGRFGKRPDLAVLALVVVFGAFVNAAGMVGPVVRWQKGVQSVLVDHSPVLALSLYFGIFLGVLPALATFLVAVVSRWWGQLRGGWLAVGTRFSYALVPLGLGMWFSHYSFHFFGSFPAVLPALQRFLLDLGWFSVGDPEWALSCCRPVADWLPRFEIVCLDIGLLTSLYAAYRIAVAESSAGRFALKAFLPWAVLIVLLFAVGVWIVLQPMQMRGMMAGA